MDLGCYAVNAVRYLAGAEPEVTKAAVRFSAIPRLRLRHYGELYEEVAEGYQRGATL